MLEKIKKLVPDAVVIQEGDSIVKLLPEDFRRVAEALRNDTEAPMDYLRDIVGMDWGEEGLGALYYLESSHTYGV